MRTKNFLLAFFGMAFLFTTFSCEQASVEGADCPQASELRAGLTIKCDGGEVVGTGIIVEDCTMDGQTNCRVAGDFKAADTSTFDMNDILVEKTIAGVAGNLTPEGVPKCTVSGDVGCYIGEGFIAAATAGLASIIVTGKSLGTIAGEATLTELDDCSGRAQVGCKTTNAFVSVEQAYLAQCINVLGLNLTSPNTGTHSNESCDAEKEQCTFSDEENGYN